MRFFTKTELSKLLGQTPAAWIRRIEERANRQRTHWTAEKSRRELLSLGRHLLQDLGFDQNGYPLVPNWQEKIDCRGCRKLE